MRFGVDEAGKGPVLGSMFAAAVLADPEDLPRGIADSKRLSPARREELAATLRANESVEIGVAEIEPSLIDDHATDMNTLTVRAQAEALAEVAADGHEGVVDAGDTDADRFGARVADRVDAHVTVDAEHGADDAYPIVAAASVIAKVERDAHVSRLDARHEGDVGSGYPGDETTTSFLADYVAAHGDLPECARRSWETSRRLLAERDQTGLDEF
ncbi:MAG: ribonuclease HII [Halanaeroarchaeum sp.]